MQYRVGTLYTGARSQRAGQVLLALFISMFVFHRPAEAGIEISVADSIVNPVDGTIGIEVLLRSDAPVGVSAYNVRLDATSALGSSLQFLGAIEVIDSLALFPGQNPLEFGTGDSLLAADNLPSGSVMVAGSWLGVLRAQVQLSGLIPGDDLDVHVNAAETFFFDGGGNEVAYQVLDSGVIQVVPEASPMMLCLPLILVGLVVHYSRTALGKQGRSAGTLR